MKTNTYLNPAMKPILFLILTTATLAAHSQSWTNRYSASGTDFTAGTAIAADASGNAIMTGVVDGTNVLTIKYSGAGLPLWTNFSGGTPTSGDGGIAVDGSGSVFVTGNTGAGDGAGANYYSTIKYSSAGAPLWTNRYDAGPEDEQQYAQSLAVDKNGDVLVTGYAGVDGNSFRSVTIKYSNAGTPLWTNGYMGPGFSSAVSVFVAVDGNGIVFVTGVAGTPGSQVCTTIKYSGAGAPQWFNDYPMDPNGLAVDSKGNAIVTGHAWNGFNLDCVTIKYSSGGFGMWTNSFNGPADGEDTSEAGVVVDSQDNVIVAGYSWTGSSYDYLTLKYSSAGIPIWTNYYDRGPMDFANDMAVDSNGNVFVTGQYDFETVAYSPAGTLLWTNRCGNGTGRAIAADFDGNVFVTGQSSNGTNYDVVTIKYAAQSSPQSLNIQRLGNSVVLSWTNAAFGLQSAPTVTGTFTNMIGATSPYTNSASGGQQFFRLVQ